MSRALIAYNIDADTSTILHINSVPSELFTLKVWSWALLYGNDVKATSTNPIWDLDFATADSGNLVSGNYRVRLTVTDTDDVTDTTYLTIIYNVDEATIRTLTAIWDQVVAILADSIPLPTQDYLTQRDKWQSILGPSFNINPLYYHQESQWDGLQNTLIAYLIVRDIIQSGANQVLANAGGAGDGVIKRVETGPVNSEWFAPSTVYSEMFKSGGMWEDLQAGICSLARLLSVHISGCKNDQPYLPTVSYQGDFSYVEQYIIAPQFKHNTNG